MSLYTLPNATSGLDNIMVQTVSSVPALTPIILAFVFFTVLLGGIARQKLRTGTADYQLWMLIASMAAFIIALLMTMVTGLIQLDWLIIVVVVTIFSAILFFLSSRPTEM